MMLRGEGGGDTCKVDGETYCKFAFLGSRRRYIAKEKLARR